MEVVEGGIVHRLIPAYLMKGGDHLSDPLSEGWVVGALSILAVAPYVPLVDWQNGLWLVVFPAHVAGSKGGWFWFCRAWAAQSWSGFVSDISLEVSGRCKDTESGEEVSLMLQVSLSAMLEVEDQVVDEDRELVEKDFGEEEEDCVVEVLFIVKWKCGTCFFLFFFYPGGVVCDDAEECSEDDSDESSGVRVVCRLDGWHPEKMVESFELIVKPRLGMNKQVQSAGCFVFRQSPINAAKSAAVPSAV
ncbi:hypothetical protein ARMGADRAFT_1036627 [Armillaria gallica]|uniref:Uncharacterized protein n=1 Tax=Armillaria gallica TaxID=47427 RepID=A0A2H3DA49_ARMGA|nr:hypothetical protein ARMGADRAFT_1036627 [Armillaria gallica]